MGGRRLEQRRCSLRPSKKVQAGLSLLPTPAIIKVSALLTHLLRCNVTFPPMNSMVRAKVMACYWLAVDGSPWFAHTYPRLQPHFGISAPKS